MTYSFDSESFHIDGGTFYRWRQAFPERGDQLLAWAQNLVDPVKYAILGVTLGEGWADFEVVPADRDLIRIVDGDLVTEGIHIPLDVPPPTWPTLRELAESAR